MVFFVVKQKTAYEMRISDWSSDVCSSDLCVYQQNSDPAQGWHGDIQLRSHGSGTGRLSRYVADGFEHRTGGGHRNFVPSNQVVADRRRNQLARLEECPVGSNPAAHDDARLPDRDRPSVARRADAGDG